MFLDLCGGLGEFVNYIMLLNLFCKVYGVMLINNLVCVYKLIVCKCKNFIIIMGFDKLGDVFDKNVVFEISIKCGNVCDLVLVDGLVDVNGCENE